MNVYDIETSFDNTETYSVVAESMGEAERIFKAKYGPITIESIRTHSVYVQIQKWDEQAREERNG